MSSSFIAAFILPSVADNNRGYVNDVLTAALGGHPIGDIGLLRNAFRVQATTYLAGGLFFGIALYRARVLARWAAALLAVGGMVSAALTMMPDAFYRLLAFPNGIAMIALGYSLWREQDGSPQAQSAPAAADPSAPPACASIIGS